MKIFSPTNIGPLTLKNRAVMAPMCMYSADLSGHVGPFHLVHYPMRAYGGIGLIIQEATAIEPRGRISDHDLGIWADEQITGLAKLVASVHEAGAKIAIQLAHAGRKSRATGMPIVSATKQPFNDKYEIPHALTKDEIEHVIDGFKQGARRAKEAGYDGIEIHGAHGYLVNQFLSPLTNQRTDDYGGSLEKRTLFLRRVIDAVRSEFTGALWVRLSAEEYEIGGHHLSDTLAVIELIKDRIDGVNVSSGGVVPITPTTFPGYQLPLAEAIRRQGLATLGGGLILSVEDAEKALIEDKADLIYFGRPLLLRPLLILEAAKKYAPELVIPQYERG